MVNTSQRFVFEAMEAIPNHRKSARCLKRLAETNLINGQYEVARKYLHLLQKTLFYKGWATETLSYIGNEEKINAHAEWGRLRQVRPREDILFDEQRMDVMLASLCEQNPENRLAYDYLMAYVMLRRDMNRFMQYYELGYQDASAAIPRSYQEALAFAWTGAHTDFREAPWNIAPQVQQNVFDFARIFTSRRPGTKATLQTRYGHTYWYYLLRDKL